jgi:hypothetical protein
LNVCSKSITSILPSGRSPQIPHSMQCRSKATRNTQAASSSKLEGDTKGVHLVDVAVPTIQPSYQGAAASAAAIRTWNCCMFLCFSIFVAQRYERFQCFTRQYRMGSRPKRFGIKSEEMGTPSWAPWATTVWEKGRSVEFLVYRLSWGTESILW